MIFEHPVFFYLWIAPHLLLIPLAILMFRKSRHKEFPIFFSYVLFEFVQFCVVFSMHALKVSYKLNLKTDLFARAGSIALHFGILQQLFHAPLANNLTLQRTTARILNWLTAVLIVLAALFIGLIYYKIPGFRMLQDYLTIEVCNVAQCGLLVLVFLWHRYLGIRMSSCVFGIALGMGLVAGSEPLMHIFKDFVRGEASRTVDCVQMAFFHAAVLIWLYFVGIRQEPPRPGNLGQLGQGREYAETLERIAHL